MEVHYFAGAPPVGVSDAAQREVAPEWPEFCAHISVAPGDAPPRTIGVVVRDAGYRDMVLGRCFLRVDASVTEGWFALDADAEKPGESKHRVRSGPCMDWLPPQDPSAYSHPAAEVYVRVEWDEYCSLQRWQGYQALLAAPEEDGDTDSELRTVSDVPGRFFRCGEMLVAVRALGVPVATRDPQLVLKTHDQCLRGYEMASTPLSPSTIEGPRRRAGSFGTGRSRDLSPVSSKEEYAAAKKAGARRNVDFGTYSFAMIQGSFPRILKLSIWERGASKLHAVAARILSIAEQTLPLPPNIPGFSEAAPKPTKPADRGGMHPSGADAENERAVDYDSSGGSDFCDLDLEDEQLDNSFTYVMHFRATTPGPAADKVTFDVRITYSLSHPPATCNIVTPRFREVFSWIGANAPEFTRRYPHAKGLTYLFVGGLFTQHYPKYFDYNRNYLSDELGLQNIGAIPIHTEHSVASNARVVRDVVMEKNGDPGSIVLISHSKGGCDVCGAIVRYPEVVERLYGVIAFQAPFGGTYLVDFVSKSKFVLGGLGGAIKGLWGGERESFLDMGYSSRLQDVLFGKSAADDQGQLVDISGKQGSGLGRDGSLSVTSDENGGLRDSRVPADAGIEVLTDAHVASRLRLYASVPIVSLASCAPYAVHKVRSIANAAGYASMAPAARIFWANTGFFNDGLVAPCDARIPYSDLVDLTDMMHTEPALYFSGTQYPPGPLTAAFLILLFEKCDREGPSKAHEAGCI